MTQNAFAMLGQGGELSRPESLEQLLSGVALLLPMLDAIPNAAIFIKDTAARRWRHSLPGLLPWPVARVLDGFYHPDRVLQPGGN